MFALDSCNVNIADAYKWKHQRSSYCHLLWKKEHNFNLLRQTYFFSRYDNEELVHFIYLKKANWLKCSLGSLLINSQKFFYGRMVACKLPAYENIDVDLVWHDKVFYNVNVMEVDGNVFLFQRRIRVRKNRGHQVNHAVPGRSQQVRQQPHHRANSGGHPSIGILW